jgi:hypothetical protein
MQKIEAGGKVKTYRDLKSSEKVRILVWKGVVVSNAAIACRIWGLNFAFFRKIGHF